MRARPKLPSRKAARRQIITGAGIAAGSIIVYPFAYGIAFTFIFLAAAGFALAIYGLIGLGSRREGRAGRAFRAARRVIQAGFIIWLASFIVVEALIIASSGGDKIEKPATVVVLGAGLHGETPSMILSARLKRVRELMEQYPEAVACLCGGQGQGETITEALAMNRYLTGAGIDEERLVMEPTSTDTAENLENAKKLLDGLYGEGRHEIIIVSNGFHLFRAKLLAEKYGMEALGSPAKDDASYLYMLPNYYLREYFSVMLFLVESTGMTVDTAWMGI